MALPLLLLQLLVLVGALRRRAGPDPLANVPEEPEEAKEEVTTSPDPKYLELAPAQWTASQLQEEVASNFTSTALFQTKLKRWCKRDDDPFFCQLKNKVTHVCPAIYMAAPALVNRSDLVSYMLEFIEAPAKEIWSRDGLVSEAKMKGVFGLSLLQTAGHPFKKLKKLLSATTTPKPHEEESHKATPQYAAEKYNSIAAEKLADPFPEVTGAAAYGDRVEEKCAGLKQRRGDACRNDARTSLLCLAAGKAAMKFTTFSTLTAKMEELQRTLPELNFRI